jgi:hypothetical protein
MANYGIGIGAFADGILRGMQLGQMYRTATDQYNARQSTQGAMADAKAARDAAVQAETARLMGLGPQGPQGPQAPGANAPAAAAPPVDPSSTQGAPTPDQGAATPPTATPNPTPAPAAAAAPSVPAAALSNAPMANSGAMAPAPTPAQAVAAARAVDAPPRPAPIQSAAQSATQSAPAASAGLPAASPSMTAAQAQALAESKTPDVMDFFMKQGVPKIAQTYLAQGDPVKAQAWMDWAQKAKSQAAMQTWADAMRSAQTGDLHAFGQNIGKLYNQYQDGTTLVGDPKTVKDNDGNVTGYNVNLKNDATGETRSQFIDKDQLLQLGLSGLAPPELFNMEYQAQLAKNQAAYKIQEMAAQAKFNTAGKIAEQNANLPNQLAVANANGGYRVQAAQEQAGGRIGAAKIEAQAKTDAATAKQTQAVNMLQNAGYSQDYINSVMPTIVGVAQKQADPTTITSKVQDSLIAHDPTYAMASPTDKQARLQQAVKDAVTVSSMMGGRTGVTGNPKPATASGIGAPPGAPAGRPFLDKQTGKVVYLP